MCVLLVCLIQLAQCAQFGTTSLERPIRISDKPHCMLENKSVATFQIHFHDRDWTSLHKFISPDVLPPEYGGHKHEVDFRKSQQFLYDNEEKLMGKTYTYLLTYSMKQSPS